MKRAVTSFFIFIFLLVPALAFAQYTPRPQPRQTGQSEQPKIVTGTLTRISDVKIQVVTKRRHVRMVSFFVIDKETVIEGDLVIGKTVRVEYTSKVIKRIDKNNIKKKTAVKITVLP